MSQIKYHYSRKLKQKLKENIESVFKNFYVFVDYMDVVDKDVCILIRESGETISTDNIGYPRTQERTMDVEIIIYIKSNDRIKDKIDNYKYLMETALFSDYEKVKLDNLCDYVELRSIQHDMVVDREKEIMALFYSINIKYQLDEQKPDELLI